MSDFLMDIAWRDFVDYASRDPKIVAEFNADTGRFYRKPTSALESAIDQVTGKADDDANAFILWVTEFYWGVDEAPEKVREAIAAKAVAEAEARKAF